MSTEEPTREELIDENRFMRDRIHVLEGELRKARQEIGNLRVEVAKQRSLRRTLDRKIASIRHVLDR